jgi:hypothetical protein
LARPEGFANRFKNPALCKAARQCEGLKKSFLNQWQMQMIGRMIAPAVSNARQPRQRVSLSRA